MAAARTGASRDRVEEGRDSAEQGAGEASRGDSQDSATERKPPMAGWGSPARTGKGEKVRQERTSDEGDFVGSVNPTRSKAKRGKRAARPL